MYISWSKFHLSLPIPEPGSVLGEGKGSGET